MPAQPTEEFVASRRVGEATVTVISDGTLTWTPRFPVPEAVRRQAMPDAGPDGALTLGLNVALVQLGGAAILIDPGCDSPGSAWARTFAAAYPPVERTPGFAAGLMSLGVPAEQIDYVLVTHAHRDHIAGVVVERDGALVPRFPRTRHLVGRADWEDNPARADPDSDLVRRLGTIERHGLLELVEGEREVVPGVTLLPAPGESPGHQVVRVRSAGEAFYYLGDLFHHACEVVNLDWVPHGDAGAARASRERLLAEIVASDALVVTAHERFPPWGRIVRSEGGHRWVRVAGDE